MEAQEIMAVAERTMAELKSATMEQPFGPEVDVCMVGGKMFILFGDGPHGVLTLKCQPEDAEALRQDYEEITPGYHMNKRHWITVYPGPHLDEDLIADLIKNSYLLAAKGIPRRIRPELSEVQFSTDVR